MVLGDWMYWSGLVYGGVGLAIAVAFLVFGLDRVDASAPGSLAFRPLLVPGLVLLWPLVIANWRRLHLRGSSAHGHRAAAPPRLD